MKPLATAAFRFSGSRPPAGSVEFAVASIDPGSRLLGVATHDLEELGLRRADRKLWSYRYIEPGIVLSDRVPDLGNRETVPLVGSKVGDESVGGRLRWLDLVEKLLVQVEG